MKDPWRGGDLPATSSTPDDDDSLATMPMWHMSCPGGRIAVRSREAADEFGGLRAVARLLRKASEGEAYLAGEPHIEVRLTGDAPQAPSGAGMRLSAARGNEAVAVYAVNLSAALPGERERQGMRLLFEAVRSAIRRSPSTARDQGVSVVIR